MDLHPTMSTEGLFTGVVAFQTYYDKAEIIDETNGVIGTIEYNPTYDNSYYAWAASGGSLVKKGLGKLWGSKKKEKSQEEKNAKRSDNMIVSITKKG